ncbi:hypothetical protein B0T18DRAFT_348931 [Schizothecium vesticola]|uniref:Uncharacterized protein n=1 Tax=Schizothecium vesticola TaxID=314040 RepID=A0AA40EWQ9_9PEZI|nr:hypothetical protein B0T18DRAFT_348931 [Schizothecium vesticola]
MGSHSEADPTHAVDGLVRAIRDLTSDPNYKLVADVFSEFLFLKDHNHRLSMSHRETMEEYRKFRNELEDTKTKIEKQKADLEGVVLDKAKEIMQLSAARASLEGDLEDTHAMLEQQRMAAFEAHEVAAKELAEVQAAREAALADLQTTKEEELAALQKTKEDELAALQTSKAQELAALQSSKAEELAALQATKAAVEEAKRLAEEAAAAAATQAADDIATLEDAKRALEQVKADNEADIVGLRDNVASLEEARARLEQIKADYEAEFATLNERIASLETQKKEVEDSLAAANLEMASLHETVAQKNTEIESLQESLRIAEEQIASLQATVEERNAEIDNLHGKLKAEGERAENALAHGEDLQARLEDTEAALQDTETRLVDLEQYRVILSDDHEDVYVTVLDTIWTNIVTLVESTFRPDIDDAILSDPSCWTNLRSSPYLKHATQLQIPLPQSNSPAAKGMRISAVLAVLSRALHRHLFRPAYLPLDDAAAEPAAGAETPLVAFLRLLEDEDPAREAHMRATLLAMLPDQQRELGLRRVQTVVREVSWLVQHLLSAVQFAEFVSGLEAACALAREQWMRIQGAVIKIEPYFGPPYDDFDWQVLELPEFGEEAQEDAPLETVDAEQPRANGTQSPHTGGGGVEGGGASIQGGGDDGYEDVDTSTLHSEDDNDVDDGEIQPEEILLVVWPSMCSVEGGDLVSITQGLVISKEQARPALEEVRSRARMIARPGSRRARTLSMQAAAAHNVQSRTSSPGPRGARVGVTQSVLGGAQLSQLQVGGAAPAGEGQGEGGGKRMGEGRGEEVAVGCEGGGEG